MPAWRWWWLDQVTNSSMNAGASLRELKRSGKTGAYFSVLNHASMYGLSLDTLGLECDRVTLRSASKVATDLEAIEVPRSAWTTVGMPCTPKTSRIISSASG